MFKKIFTAIIILLSSPVLFAQAPDHYPPTVPQPVDITLFNLILYILLPIGLIIAYLLYQRSQKKKRNKNRNDSSGTENFH